MSEGQGYSSGVSEETYEVYQGTPTTTYVQEQVVYASPHPHPSPSPSAGFPVYRPRQQTVFSPSMSVNNAHRYRMPQAGSLRSPEPGFQAIKPGGQQRFLRAPQSNIRLVVQSKPPVQSVYHIKPDFPSGMPPRMVMETPGVNASPQVQQVVPQAPIRQGGVTWSANGPTTTLLHSFPPQPQQQAQQHPQQQQQSKVFQSPPSSEIAYNVEHVFLENGTEVKKMPIKYEDKTIWVDCVPTVPPENQEDQVVFDLLDPSLGGNSTSSSTSSPPSPSSGSTAVTMTPHLPEAGKDCKEKEKESIISAVLNDLISPTELSARHGISVSKIRDWVKATGNKLPSKYKVKFEKIKTAVPPQQIGKNIVHSQPTPLVVNQPTFNNMTPMNIIRESPLHPPIRFHTLSPPRQPIQQHQQPHLTNSEPRKITPGNTQYISPEAPQTPPSHKQIVISRPLPTISEMYKPKLIPGKLALCKNCGSKSPDFNRCIRCKKHIPEAGVKILEDPNSARAPSTVMSAVKVELKSPGGLRLQPMETPLTTAPVAKVVSEEPECIALSSDEEGGGNEEEEENNEGSGDGGRASELSENPPSSQQQPLQQEDGVSSQASLSLGLGDSSLVSKEDEKASSFSVVDDPITGDYISLSVRSIRVGSYKSAPRDKVIFTEKGVRLIVPSLSEPSSSVTLDIPKEDILQFLAHFGKGMPIFFLFTSISSNKSIRDKLQMDHRTGLWLDVASSDETQKRITILPDKINEDVKHILLKNYGEGLLKEIESKEANDILVRSSPKEPSLFRIGGPALSRGQQPPSVKYCTFPPSSQNSVTVSTEDYCVLEDECFLNDVIIDFYTRYLQYKLFSEADRERTHIFSTFFYNRLTSRPKKMKNKPHPVEDNPNLSAAEKRYERVKRWTKKVDLFSKDFVIVPINEHSHWFVAIICYPGELGPTRLDNGEPVEPQELKRNPHRIKMPKQIQKRIVQIGSTTIIPVRTTITATVNGTPEVIKPTLPEEDISDRDEAEASDDDMMDEEPNFPRFNNVFFPPPIQPPPSSNLPQNKEQDSNNTPVNQEEGQKAEPKEGEPNSLESEKSEEPKGEEEVNKSSPQSPQSPKEQKTEETNPQENFPESPEEHVPIRQPCILIFDSLATGSRARVVATLRDYLMCEHKAKKGSERSFTKENIMGHCPKVPQQPNFSDCGIFLLQYVESFFKSPIPNYHLPIKSLRGWFPPEVVRHKRSDIGKIIRDLAQEQNPGKNLPFPNIMFAPPTGSGYTDDEDMEEELGEEEDIGEEEGEEEEAEEEEQGVEEEEGMEGGEEEVAIPSSQAEEEIPSPASPDSTSLNDLPNPLVDYSDSNSPDDTLPDSSGSNSKRTLIDDDEPSSPTHESSKKPKLDSSS